MVCHEKVVSKARNETLKLHLLRWVDVNRGHTKFYQNRSFFVCSEKETRAFSAHTLEGGVSFTFVFTVRPSLSSRGQDCVEVGSRESSLFCWAMGAFQEAR